MAQTKQLILAKFYTDPYVAWTGVSDDRVIHPVSVFEAEVLQWGDIDRNIPILPGLPQTSDTHIRVADVFRKWRHFQIVNQTRRMLCDMIVIPEGTGDGKLLFTGEVIDPEFGPGYVDFRLKDNLFSFLDETLAPTIVSEIHPFVAPNDEGGFLNFIFGRMRSFGPNPRGVVPCPHVGQTGSIDRYGLARHKISALVAVYRNGPDGWELVSTAEYTVTTISVVCWNMLEDHLFIDFAEDQKGAEIRADVDGLTLPFEASPIRNPILVFKAMVSFMLKDSNLGDTPVLTGFDVASLSSVQTKFTSLGYVADFCISQEITGREFFGRFLTSFNLDMYSSFQGLVTLNFTDNAALVADAKVREGRHILHNTFVESLPDVISEQTNFRYAYNNATNNFEITRTASTGDAADSPPITKKVEKDTVDLFYVRDKNVAADVITRRMQWMARNSYRQKFDIPMPPFIEVPPLDLSKIIDFSHSQGLDEDPVLGPGYVNKLIKVYGLALTPGTLTFHVRTVIGVQRTVTFQEPGEDQTTGNGGTGEVSPTNDKGGECCGGFIFATRFVDAPITTATNGDVDMYLDASTIGRFASPAEEASPPTHSPGKNNFREWGPIWHFIDPVVEQFQGPGVDSPPLSPPITAADITHGGIKLIAAKSAGTDLQLYIKDFGSPAIFDNGPARFFVSYDNQSYEMVLEIPQDDFLQADQYGFFINEQSNVYNAQAQLLHFHEDDVGFSAAFVALFFGVDTQAIGIFIRQSSTGKLVTLQQTSTSSGLLLEVNKYNNSSSFNSAYLSQLILAPMLFMRIELKPTTIQPCPNFSIAIEITINRNQLPSTQSNFVVPIEITDNRLKLVANGGFVQDAQGDDIRPSLTTNCTQISYERDNVSYNGATGTIILYVLLGTVNGANASSDTRFQLNVGNSTLTTDGSTELPWAGYTSVVHFNAVGAGLYAVRDSTYSPLLGSPGRAWTAFGGVGSAVAQIGNGASFDGINDEFRLDEEMTNSRPFAGTQDGTVMWWMKTSTADKYIWGKVNFLYCHGIGTTSFVYMDITAAGKLHSEWRNSGHTVIHNVTSSGSVNNNVWRFCVMTRSGTTVKIYIDGVLDVTSNASSTVNVADDGGQFEIGTIGFGDCGRYYSGLIDEFRAYNGIAFDQDRITAEYNAQKNSKNPSTFYTTS